MSFYILQVGERAELREKVAALDVHQDILGEHAKEMIAEALDSSEADHVFVVEASGHFSTLSGQGNVTLSIKPVQR